MVSGRRLKERGPAPRHTPTASEILSGVIVNRSDSGAAMQQSSQGSASRGERTGGTPQPGPRQHDTTAGPAPETLIEIPNRRLHRHTRVKPGEQTTTIRQAGPGTRGEPLAHVHVPQDAPKGGRMARPPFTVTGVDGATLCSVRSAGTGRYDVYGADGAPIGRITRHPGRLLWPRRVRWSVRPAHGGPELAAEVGPVRTWVVLCVISPLYFVCWAIMAAYGSLALLFGDKESAKEDAKWEMELPAWTRWRTPDDADAALEYKSDRVYRLVPSRVDWRLAYAQAVLHVWDRG
ncbi:hypothetical protein GCM10010240_64250 [Streptomyces griseoviridis]|nr:hypothetical protein GCM10010240_64250 [Streptomyces griseoviridis]